MGANGIAKGIQLKDVSIKPELESGYLDVAHHEDNLIHLW
jgi:hypothetical protein